jgi:glycine amidinotransferase
MINSFNEWSPLKEVIVGSPINYNTQDLELSFKLFFHDVAYTAFCYPYYERRDDKESAITPKNNSTRELRKQYLEELTEDVNELVKTLEQLGVKVYRPMTLNQPIKFKTPYWESVCIPALNVRDQALIIGNEIIETPPQIRARYFENDLLKPIFYKYFHQGARWTTMPKPIMTDQSFDISYVSSDRTPCVENIYTQKISEFDI